MWLGHAGHFRKDLLSWKHASSGLGQFARSPNKVWMEAGWEREFWLSHFVSSLAVCVSSSLPAWPGLLCAGAPQPGALVLGRDCPHAGASCLSPASPSVTTIEDSFCLIHVWNMQQLVTFQIGGPSPGFKKKKKVGIHSTVYVNFLFLLWQNIA